MQYDEQRFKKSSNRKAMVMWLILGVVLSAAYAIEIVKELRTIGYYLQFLSLCWIPFILGLVVLKVKGMDAEIYKYIIALGYGAFYVFVLLTTTSPLAFVFLLPLTSMLILYKNRNFMLTCGIAHLIVLGISIAVNIGRGLNGASDITQYEIQVASTALCYAGYILSINHMNSSDGAMMGSLKENLDKVITTVEAVKVASNDIVDGVSTVRELTDENIMGANTVVSGMANLTNNNTELQRSTASSLNLTETIGMQVQNVASKISRMVELAAESTGNAKTSAEELSDVVDLSTEVEEILREFANQFKTMTDEIHTIESITMQTNILSLNASVEAARAGAAGKGFAVVAGEIRELSSKTKNSSDSIFSALQHLESTSHKMTDSITKTLKKVKQVNLSVGKITDDTTQMGDNIHVIDGAMTEVKVSNAKLVENMHGVSDVVGRMTESIVSSEQATRAMLAKNMETTKNVADVETIVGKLMTELGVIGVMGMKDIQEGQFATLSRGNDEYRVRIGEILSDGLRLELLQDWRPIPGALYDFVATVGNSYYKWDRVEMTPMIQNGEKAWKINLTRHPSVTNRRKYKRIPLSNTAHLTIPDTNYVCHGMMINISEGGYAFLTGDPHVASARHKTVSLSIDNFIPLKAHELDAKVIRLGEEQGQIILGCRFLYDNMELRNILRTQ